MSLLQMSFSGAVLILAVVIIRTVGIHKLPKKTFMVLWNIVLLRLLVPFSIPSVFSLHSLMNRSTGEKVFDGTQVRNFIPVMLREQFETMEEKLAEHLTFVPIWSVVWWAGMIFCIMFFATTYLHGYFQFQASLSVQNSYVEEWLKAHRLKRSLCIRQSDKITTPLTYGIFRPVIVMPKDTDWENMRQVQYILLHEYVHICHYDSVIKLISALALCIHWFNPLVWVMFALLDRDIELSCDESVVRRSGISEKSAYAKMLICMEAKKSGLMLFYSGFNKNAIEERIEAIMRMKKTSLLSLSAAMIVIAGIAAAFAAFAAESENPRIDFNLDTVLDGDIDKESKYADYIENRIASDIENYYEFTACKIDVSFSDGEIVSAEIRVVTEDDETNALETDILDRVSKALGIPTENITLYFSTPASIS